MNDKPWKDRSKSNTPRFHDERMKRLRRPEPDIPKAVNQSGEAMVVPGYQISTVMKAWIVEYLKERPLKHRSTGNEFKKGESSFEFMGPIDLLAERSGVNIRQVSRICNGELKMVGESYAEKLLIAIDQSYMLSNGEIQVVPNPNWSTERWIKYMQEQSCY